MKYPILLLSLCAAFTATGQPVVKVDAVALLAEMPVPPTSLTEAYQRTYASPTAGPDGKAYYQPTFDRLTALQQENQQLSLRFYQQHPTGVPTMPQQPANRVSTKDKAAMGSATSELAQKMMSDPAFAQQFAQMSETEQQAYIAKLLTDKGLKPAQGQASTNDKPMPGTDMDWVTPCNTFLQATMDLQRWDQQTALQQRYAAQHDAVNAWAEAEIKKLPLIEMGEYGHDRDPELVKALQKQALDKHRQVADAMMKDAARLFADFRQEARLRMTSLNDALKKAGYGENYSFGLHYTLILQTQGTMLGDLQALLTNEISIMEEVARWEHDWQIFQ